MPPWSHGCVFSGGRAPEDLEDLVDLRVTWEERVAAEDHLCEDAPDGPHVDRSRVVSRAEKDFGCAVPQGDDLRGKVQKR